MSALEMKTRYDPSEVEPRIAREWIESGLTHPDAAGDSSENYSIAIPPPNVTGVLHMGHALNNAIQDTLVRRARQQGKRTRWILGTDHAGIATQTQVEKELKSLGTSREELGREQFVARVWSWRELYGSRIIEQIKRLGSSADFQNERFTLDRCIRGGGRQGLRRPLQRRVTSTATATSSTGIRAAVRRSPTSRSRIARSPTRSTTSTTRSHPAAGRSRSPPCAPRRCSPTSRSPSIRRTSATSA